MLSAAAVWAIYLAVLACLATATGLAWRQSLKPTHGQGRLRLFSLGFIANTAALLALLAMNFHLYLRNRGLVARADVMRFYGWFVFGSVLGFAGALFGRGRGRMYLLAASLGTAAILYAFLGMSL